MYRCIYVYIYIYVHIYTYRDPGTYYVVVISIPVSYTGWVGFGLAGPVYKVLQRSLEGMLINTSRLVEPI